MNKNKIGWNIVKIIVGVFIFLLVVNVFVILNNLGEGGVIGLIMMFYYLFGWILVVIIFIFNGILFIIGYKFFD